jgi:hypothetical protein
MTGTGPGRQVCRTVVSIGSGKRSGAPGVPRRGFRCDAAVCAACPWRPAWVQAKPGRGRLGMRHPQAAVQQEARAFQRSEAVAPYRRRRQVADHRLARLMHLGLRQARSGGRAKTLGQRLLAATVAKLTLVATTGGLLRGRSPRPRLLGARLLSLVVRLLTACQLAVAHSLSRQHWATAEAGGGGAAALLERSET